MRSSGYCHIPHYMLFVKDLSWSLEDAASAEARTGNAGIFCSLNFITVTPLGVE